MATIDHLYSKFNPLRWVQKTDDQLTKVLSCYDCNNTRARLEESMIPRKERQLRGNKGIKFNHKKLFAKTCNDYTEVIEKLKKAGLDRLTVIPLEDVVLLMKGQLTISRADV
jgi:hypothetical protein